MNDRSGPPGDVAERLAALAPGLELLGLPVCVFDLEMRYVHANRAFARQTGRTIAELLGRTQEEVFGPSADDGRREHLRRALAGKADAFNRRSVAGIHKGRWFRAHYFPLREGDGPVWGALLVLVDVQQLKDAEAALGERERHLSLITDAVGFPIVYIDRQRVVRFVNRPAAQWAGLAPEAQAGRRLDEVLPPQVLGAADPYLERAFAGEAVTYEHEALWPGREPRRMRGHAIPDRDASGEVRGILVVLFDIEEDWRLRRDLDAQRKRLQLVLENIGVPMCYLDRELRVRFANQPGVDWRIPTVQEALGRHVSEVFDAETLAVIGPEIAAAMRGEKRVYERQARLPGGEARWVRVYVVPDMDDGGGVRGLYSLVVDVDVDHRMREALQRQEAELRHFAENLPGPVALVDAQFRYVFANKVFERLRGLEPGDIVGRPVREVMGEELAREYYDPFVEPLKRGEACTYERCVGLPGGEKRWFLVRLVPNPDADGRFNGYYIVASDIHDIKLGEERLREQQARLRLFADNIPDAVAYLDRDRRILFANRQFAALRGMRLSEIIGKTTAEAMGAEVAAWIAGRTQRVLERGEVATYERLTTLPDGAKRWFHVKAVPHCGDDGGVLGMYVVAHDIHEVKAAQAQLAAREEELRFFAENIPEAICYIDLERGCTFVNNVFLATRGVKREDSLGRFPEDVYPREVLDGLSPHLTRVLLGEEALYERTIRLSSGEERWVRVRLTPRRDEAGVVRGYYVVSTDIHEIKAAQAEVEDKERQLRQVIDSVPTPMCYVDAELRYRYVNNAFLDYIGLEAREIVGRPVVDVLGEERFRQLHPHLERLKLGEALAVERLVRFADGRARWMIVRLTPRISDGRYLGYYATTSDIHEQKTVEEELRRANGILSAHFDNTPLAVIEWDTELRIVRWSGQAEPVFGWSASEALGRSLAAWRIVYEDDRGSVEHAIAELVQGPGRHATLLSRSYRKDGSVIWVEWHHSALRDDAGRLVSILSLAQDVSSRIQAEERLQYMATHDGLTGLPNSVLLNDRLDAALVRARRSHARVAVMFLDLDHFKDVNDTLGHRVGDLLLKELARRIRGALRQSDVLARVSGDEFVVMLEDFPDENAPELVARKVLDEVRRPFQIEGHEIHVSGSLGLALHPEDGSDVEALLKNADAAMYHAKELGRNGFRLFSAELAERRTQRLQVETALRRALRAGELALHYQPIVDTDTGEVRRVEALLRWHDPERGMVLPQGFVPLAEESGLGHAVGHWVLEAACRQARAWRDAGLGDIGVCVNLSAGQLRDTGMIADLKRTLAATGCEPGWLVFEITETSMVRDVEGASLVLSKLRALGVRVAIDDFGTGFSSLSHLRHLPVDVLKIDKAFVADIDGEGERGPRARLPRGGDSAGGAAIVSAVIGLARGLGLDVVAEGVERKAQLHFLAKQGCSACQGYLLCPPLPANELEEWLRDRKRLGAKRRAKRKARSS
ncbi:MAG TPA: PAS domain-containing protein [Usitatibacter sp.]|nr:PAS domain-containing protein [Usitatibacter sp.]